MFDFSLAHGIANVGLIAGGTTLAVTLASSMFKFINPVTQAWDNALKSTNKNIFNKNGETFKLLKVKEVRGNYKAKCKIPNGLSFKQLEDVKNVLEDNLGAVIQLDHGNFSRFVNIDIITSKPNLDFKPISCDCSKLFLGYKPNGKAYLVDMNINPHILFTGRTGSGKTTALFMAITNLLYNQDKYYELWFAQIVNRETEMFSDCSNVKIISNTLEETKIMLDRLIKICDSRAESMMKCNCRNIEQYNRFNKRKINRIYLVLEEFSFFAYADNERKEIKELKQSCEEAILRISKAGRSLGVSILACIQKPSYQSINTTVRSQMSVLTFKLKSEGESKIAIESSEAINLNARECIFDGASEHDFLIAPKVDRDLEVLKQYVPEIRLPGDIKPREDHITDTSKKVKDNVTVLPPIVIAENNLEVATDLSPGEEKVVVPKVKTNGKYDKDLLKFIENFKSITVKQAEIMFYKNNNNARRRLKELENQGILKSYKYNKTALAYTYKEFKEISEHDTIRNDFVAQLVGQGSTIIDFKLTPRCLNEMIIPDLFIKYSYQNKVYTSYVEIDLTHFTSDNKITLYNKLFQQEDFNLFILRDSMPQFRILPKFQTRVLPLKKFTINI